MALNSKKIFGYGCLGVLTAPVWVPVAFATYVGVKMTRFAFKHATPVALGLSIAGAITYAGCHYKEPMIQATSAIAQHVAPTTVTLEQRVLTQSVTPTTLSMIDETNTAYYYVHEGETLGQIAAKITGTSSSYRTIATANKLPNPDDVPVGTLLRIPEQLCTRTVPGLYDKVPSLNSLVLPGTATITQMFGPKAPEILAVNRALGLSYQDAFAYPAGERVVWFP